MLKNKKRAVWLFFLSEIDSGHKPTTIKSTTFYKILSNLKQVIIDTDLIMFFRKSLLGLWGINVGL